MPLEIKITSVKDSGDDILEAEIVSFEVIQGEPVKNDIYQLIENNSTAVCNISYQQDDKTGSFIDTNFEFKKDQIIS